MVSSTVYVQPLNFPQLIIYRSSNSGKCSDLLFTVSGPYQKYAFVLITTSSINTKWEEAQPRWKADVATKSQQSFLYF